ncbi:hypothetical protein ACE02Y_14515 [Shewanella xiamenensis]|jgi:phosphatidylglycerophosphatase A|uniref:Periplasmic protein n=1 Tax=Shewanella xiamenensis TaxID=332186 RepID=A0A073KNP1_9GAMM|nr:MULTISPECIES: hypothetical protein [Shewanella]PZP27412.1 MAG: hypothetical protein DI594_20855 [Shewanella oneidensis]ASF15029.1 hypothetical protein CEQ32_08505 [Shewanella sp. FDAARGOS_354]KEK28909.1 hypothetical protein SXM_1352 [Shewanella xiamenensis]KPN76440.1 hypothetical protein AEA42_13560 [Shewanella sp. Sh95]MBW0280771.1 hypothetical protein [Shewanella xiamenensis]
MFNLKSAFALVLVSALSANVYANVINAEIIIDTSDLQTSINAELTATMEKMHQEALQDPTLLIADEVLPAQQVVKTE